MFRCAAVNQVALGRKLILLQLFSLVRMQRMRLHGWVVNDGTSGSGDVLTVADLFETTTKAVWGEGAFGGQRVGQSQTWDLMLFWLEILLVSVGLRVEFVANSAAWFLMVFMLSPRCLHAVRTLSELCGSGLPTCPSSKPSCVVHRIEVSAPGEWESTSNAIVHGHPTFWVEELLRKCLRAMQPMQAVPILERSSLILPLPQGLARVLFGSWLEVYSEELVSPPWSAPTLLRRTGQRARPSASRRR